MEDYYKIKQEILKQYPESDLRKPSGYEMADMVSSNPGVAQDFVSFLAQVGYGTIGESNFAVYFWPKKSSEVFDEKTAKNLESYVFVGDNYSGFMVGYDTSGIIWKLVTFDHSDIEERNLGQMNFGELIERELLT